MSYRKYESEASLEELEDLTTELLSLKPYHSVRLNYETAKEASAARLTLYGHFNQNNITSEFKIMRRGDLSIEVMRKAAFTATRVVSEQPSMSQEELSRIAKEVEKNLSLRSKEHLASEQSSSELGFQTRKHLPTPKG